MTGNATACERKVVAIPAGRLGNQIFQFAVCYAIAVESRLCIKAPAALCRAFAMSGEGVICSGSPRGAAQVRLRPPSSWWGPEDARGTRHAIAKEPSASADFQCLGHRQNARIFRGVDVRGALGGFVPDVAARAAALWDAEVAPAASGGRAGAVVVALYHRVAADSVAYRQCLPGPRFYAAARKRFAALFPGRDVVYVTSSYQFANRAAIDALLGPGVVAVDDADPAVVLAALAKADASTFSWGTFSWWAAYLAAGPVLYDARLRDPAGLAATGCAGLVGARHANLSRFADEHLPASWIPLLPEEGGSLP